MKEEGLEAKDAMGRTAVHLMVHAGNLDMINYLLGCGAKAATQGKYGETPLLLALRLKRLDIAEVLVAHMGGQALEAKDERGRTALHWAVEDFGLGIVKLLLSAGAKVVSENKDRETLMLSAVQRGHVGIMAALAKHITGHELEAKDRHGMTALHLAVEFNRTEMVNLLLSAGASTVSKTVNDETPLMLAVVKGYMSVAEVLLKHTAGQGLEAEDSTGRTALHWAAKRNRAEMATLLIAAGANTVSKTVHGETPLMLAALEGHLGMVNPLAQHMDERGLQERSRSGLTALHCAMHAEVPDDVVFPVVRALLFAGVPYMGEDRFGATARDSAEHRGSLRCVELMDVSIYEPKF
jgi:ankyrin repeat protein